MDDSTLDMHEQHGEGEEAPARDHPLCWLFWLALGFAAGAVTLANWRR